MKTKEMVLASIFAAITCVLSMIPPVFYIGPIPVTLQVLAVLLAGAILGKKLGCISLSIYVLLGAIGLPVYSGMSSGLGVLFGPTGGFIISFIVATFVVGLLTDTYYKKISNEKLKIVLLFTSMVLGIIIIYVLGGLQLALVNKTNIIATIKSIFAFLPIDLGKAIVATMLSYILKKQLVKANLLS